MVVIHMKGVDPGSGERGGAGRAHHITIHGQFQRFSVFKNVKEFLQMGAGAGGGRRLPPGSALA
jgi:hypothetical protein